MSILFTTGATVTFQPLIEYVTTADFLQFLQHQGFSKVTIQYGNETDSKGNNVSKKIFSEALARGGAVARLDLQIQNCTNDKSTTTLANDLFSVEAFAYSNDIQAYISQADVVVSHAGTGSILDTLRAQVPLIVVVNDSLMDNHQLEVASQFESAGYLLLVRSGDLASGALCQKIAMFQNGGLALKPFPEQKGTALSEILGQELAKS